LKNYGSNTNWWVMYSHVLAIDLRRLSQSPLWWGLDLVSYLVSYVTSRLSDATKRDARVSLADLYGLCSRSTTSPTRRSMANIQIHDTVGKTHLFFLLNAWGIFFYNQEHVCVKIEAQFEANQVNAWIAQRAARFGAANQQRPREITRMLISQEIGVIM